MKMVLGACALARSNKHRTMRSLSPRHLEAKVAEETLKKVVPHSVATALARSVFPVPGGPNMRTPFHGLLIPCNNTKQCSIELLILCLDPLKQKFSSPSCICYLTWKYWGIHKGSRRASSRRLFAWVSPATSSHLTPGHLSNTSLSNISAISGSGPSYSYFFDFFPSPFYYPSTTRKILLCTTLQLWCDTI